MNGLIFLDPHHQVVKIVLSRADPFARELCTGFSALFAHEQIAITLGEI
jgi:hypothetical protein